MKGMERVGHLPNESSAQQGALQTHGSSAGQHPPAVELACFRVPAYMA